MFSIAALLDRAKASAGIESDYRLAKVIGITHSAVTHYRMGRSLPNESVIDQLCALSGDDPDITMAQVQAARSKDAPARAAWLRIAARMSGAASTAILSALVLLAAAVSFPMESNACQSHATDSVAVDRVHIVSIQRCA